MKRIITFVGIIVLIFGLFSCASSGPVYQKIETIPEGKALVYFYRPKMTLASAITYHVSKGKTRIGDLKNGSYFPYFCEPGKSNFSVNNENSKLKEFEIKEGKTYYIELGLVSGFSVKTELLRQYNEVGEDSIKNCYLHAN